jgi:hypothetical protein
MKTGLPRLRSDSHEALLTENLDPGKSLTRTTQGQAGRPPLIHLSTNKAFNATIYVNMATMPPAWEQHLCLILLFTTHPGMAVKTLPLFTPHRTLFYHQRPLDSQNDNQCTRVFWGSALSVPRRPSPLRSNQALSTTGQQRNDARMLTTWDRTLVTGPRAFHRPIINVTLTLWGWPPITKAHRYSNLCSTRQTFSSKTSI